VKWEERYVAGVSKVARLHRASGVMNHREGFAESAPRRPPDRTEYEAVTLEHGVTYDSDFAKWAGKVWTSGVDSQGPPEDLRKDILIDVYDEAGQLALSCKVFHCWVSDFQGLPDLDANASGVAIQRLTLEEEGWECDCS
jgi:phage tail-like protein